jgi:cell division transport system ATP-binding protein
VLRLISVTLTLDDRTVLDDVTLEVRTGELLVLDGGRGAGKSTLLQVAAARRRPDGGEVWIADHEVSRLQRDSLPFVRRNIGVAAAQPRFLAGLTVLENVMLPLGARSEPLDWAREAALRALGKVGAVGLSTADAARLSASERRLVGLARALAGAPPLCLVDDPSAALGAADAGAVLSALQSTAESGAAVVCASADAAFVAAATRAGARRVRLESGRVQMGSGAMTVVSGWRGSDAARARAGSPLGIAADPVPDPEPTHEARP